MNAPERRSLEAAFHHAGHAVAAHLSKYHALALPLRLDAWGGGEVTAALSRRKLVAADKVATAAARVDPEVAESIALILCAGLASERLAAERRAPVTPDPARSAGDFEMARAELRGAGLPDDTGPHEISAAALLALHWQRVAAVAERLVVVEELSPTEIAALLEPD
ncbi:MAG: hypothetical protein ABI745_01860 [Caldimonas sp.]